MVNTAGMDPLDFLTKEELLRFLHIKKTEMSCLEKPHIFLNQLRDHNLVPEDQYKKVLRMKSKQQKEKGLYQILDWLETERPHCINLFWRCLFKDHIMLEYPVIRLLRNSLLDGSFHFAEDLPEKQETSAVCEKEEKKEEKEAKGKKCVKKSDKKTSENVEVEEDEEPGPSTRSTPTKRKRQQKPSFSSPIKKGEKPDIWNWTFCKTLLPVTCGDKQGMLQRDKMARGEKCILSEGRWFTPTAFEEFGGRKNYKNWKQSIRCRNTPLQKLLKEGHLKCTPFKSQQNLNNQSKKRRTSSLPAGQLGDKYSGSPIKKGEKPDIWNWTFCKMQLPVTCGDKQGMLQRDKMARGEKCILSEGRWFTPTAFEEFGGRKNYKNWKQSIRCRNTPLQKLLKEGHLKCTPFKSQQNLNNQSKKRRTSSPPAGQLGHKYSESDSDFEEEEGQEDSEIEIEEEEEQEGDEEEEEEQEGNEEEGENRVEERGGNGDPEAAGNGNNEGASEFSADRLPVTCGSATGTLQKDRFGSGTSGKCIRTASGWMTPVEFSKEDKAQANSFWRRSILVQGVPFSELIERRVLMIHSLLCKCKNCSKEQRDLDEQKNDDHCSVCGRRGSLLCCDQCPRAFHPGCHIPSVEENMLGYTQPKHREDPSHPLHFFCFTISLAGNGLGPYSEFSNICQLVRCQRSGRYPWVGNQCFGS